MYTSQSLLGREGGSRFLMRVSVGSMDSPDTPLVALALALLALGDLGDLAEGTFLEFVLALEEEEEGGALEGGELVLTADMANQMRKVLRPNQGLESGVTHCSSSSSFVCFFLSLFCFLPFPSLACLRSFMHLVSVDFSLLSAWTYLQP